MQKKVKFSSPGKISVAGEWAVLEKGNPMIVAALETRVLVSLKESRDGLFRFTIRDSGVKDEKAIFQKGKLKFLKRLSAQKTQDVLFIRKTLETFLSYQKAVLPCRIETRGKGVSAAVGKSCVKLGFGSSAAAVVALTSALFKFYGENITSLHAKEKIYKISAISHYLAQGKVGSGFDVAASTFGGIVVYKRFAPEWLEKQINSGRDLEKIIEVPWPGFSIERLSQSGGMEILVGWTGKSSSTADMIKKMNGWKGNNRAEYEKIISAIKGVVEGLISAWKAGDRNKILKSVRENERWLRVLGKKSGVNIETRTLRALSVIADEAGGAGKLSGAGGGDCGIALSFGRRQSAEIRKKWKEKGIVPIDVKISSEGVKEC